MQAIRYPSIKNKYFLKIVTQVKGYLIFPDFEEKEYDCGL